MNILLNKLCNRIVPSLVDNVFNNSSPFRRFYAFLIKQAIGKFLKYDIEPDDVRIQLSSGRCEINNIELDCEVLNDLVLDLPFRFTRVYFESCSAFVPWSNLGTKQCQLSFTGLYVDAIPTPNNPDCMEFSVLRQTELSAENESKETETQQQKLHSEFQKALLASTPDLDDDAKTALHDAIPDSNDELTKKGVKEIKNFLENVLTSTEIKIKDVFISLAHPNKARTEEIVLRVCLPEISFKNSDSECVRSNSSEETTYFKAVRFTGFRAELFERSLSNPDNYVPQTIACAASQEPSIVKLKVSVDADGATSVSPVHQESENCSRESLPPRVDIRSFVKGFRCLMTARHLTSLLQLLEALRHSSDLVALHQQKAAEDSAQGRKESLPDLGWHPADAVPADESSSQQVSLWNMSIQFAQVSLTLIQDENSLWPSDWWMSSEPLPDNSLFTSQDGHIPSGVFCRPTISRLDDAHILFVLKNVHIMAHQTPMDSFSGIDMTEVELYEFLKPVAPQAHHEAEYGKLLVRRVVVFDSSCEAAFPTLSSLTASFSAPLPKFSNPSVRFTSQRLLSLEQSDGDVDDYVLRNVVTLQPVLIEYDLGLPTRLEQLWNAFTSNIEVADSKTKFERSSFDFPDSPQDLPNDNISLVETKSLTTIKAENIRFRISIPASSRNRGSSTTASVASLGRSASSSKLYGSASTDNFVNTDPRGLMRSEHLVLEVVQLEASTETLLSPELPPEDQAPESWSVLCENCVLDLYYEENGTLSAHKIVQGIAAISKTQGNEGVVYHPQAFITFKNTSQLADEPIENLLASKGLPNVRIWESEIGGDQMKSQVFHNEKDREASGHDFQMFARRNAPFHIQIELPFTCINITKMEYDLLMNLYVDVVAFLDSLKHPPQSQSQSPSDILAGIPDLEEEKHQSDSLFSDDDLPFLETNRLSIDSCGTAEFVDAVSDHSDDEMFYSVVEQIDYDALAFDDGLLGKEDITFDETEPPQPSTPDSKELNASSSSMEQILSSMKIILRQGIVDMSENQDGSASSTSPPQTLRLDVQDLHVSHIVRQEMSQDDSKLDDGKSELDEISKPMKSSPATYVTLTAGDATLWEFTDVLPRNHCHDANASEEEPAPDCIPILFRTMLPQGTFGIGCGDVNVLHAFIVLRMKDCMLETEETDSFLSIFALLDLRAMTFQYRVESQWMDKASDFFTLEHSAPQETSETMKDEASVFVHAYDCVVDYNPNEIDSRAVFSLGKVKISASIIEETLQFSYKIDVNDGAIFLVNKTEKTCFSPLMVHTQQKQGASFESKEENDDGFAISYSNCTLLEHLPVLRQPFLHHLPGDSLFGNLEPINFVRVAGLDYLEAFIKQATRSSHMSLEITGGNFTILTCSDSGGTLVELFNFFSESITGPLKRKDVDVFFPQKEQGSERKSREPEETMRDSMSASALSLDFSRQTFEQTSASLTSSHLSNFQHDMSLSRSASSKVISPPINILADIDEDMFKDPSVKDSRELPSSIAKLSQYSIDKDYKEPTHKPVQINFITDHVPHPNSQDSLRNSPTTASTTRSRSTKSTRLNQYSKTFHNQNSQQPQSPQRDVRVIHDMFDHSPSPHANAARMQSPSALTFKDREQNNFWDREDPVDANPELGGTWFVPPSPQSAGSPQVESPSSSFSSTSNTRHPELIENYADQVSQDQVGGTYTKKLPAEFPCPLSMITVNTDEFVWRLFGGHDWATEDEIRHNRKKTRHRRSSSYETVPPVPSPPPTKRQIRIEYADPDRGHDLEEIKHDMGPQYINSGSKKDSWKSELSGSPGHATDLRSRVSLLNPRTSRRTSSSASDSSDHASAHVGEHSLKSKRLRHGSLSKKDKQTGKLNTGKSSTQGLDTFITSEIETSLDGSTDGLPYQQKNAKRKSGSVPATKFGSSRRKGKGRRTDEVMELRFVGFELVYHGFEKHEMFAGRTIVNVDDAEIIDLIQTSNFKKFACYYRRDDKPRITESKMFQFSSVSVRPDPTRHPETEDVRVSIKLLPVRLNIDQDAIDFIAAYFFGGSSDEQSPNPSRSATPQQPRAESSHHAPPELHLPPSRSRTSSQDSSQSNPQSRRSSTSQFGEEKSEMKSHSCPDPSDVPAIVYIQSFKIHGLQICVDYKPKHVDYDSLKSGDLSQLIHMFPLQGVEINLKRFESPGVQGWGAAFGSLLKYWGEDISKSQAHHYLAGVQPIRSICRLGSGIADLVLIPVYQYKSDGRILYGVTKGTSSFARSVALEAVQLGNDLAAVSQSLLEGLDTAITSALTSQSPDRPSHMPRPRVSRNTRARRTTRQPKSFSEGIHQAYESLCLGIQAAGNGVIAIPLEEYRRAGYKGYVASMLRGVPGALLQPMIGATEALSKALVGVRNSVHPIRRLEAQDKYKPRGRSGHK